MLPATSGKAGPGPGDAVSLLLLFLCVARGLSRCTFLDPVSEYRSVLELLSVVWVRLQILPCGLDSSVMSSYNVPLSLGIQLANSGLWVFIEAFRCPTLG